MKAVVEGVEVEGEPREIAALIRELKPIAKTRPVVASKASEAVAKREPPVPTVDQICEYIRSKPNYEHTTNELCGKLYHREIGPFRSQDKDYVFFYHRTQTARAKIETQEHGKFKRDDEREAYRFYKP